MNNHGVSNANKETKIVVKQENDNATSRDALFGVSPMIMNSHVHLPPHELL